MYRSSFAFVLAIAALAAILLPSSLSAQITFQRTYGGAGYEEGREVQQTSDGGYVIVGVTTSFGAGCSDAYLIRTGANGDTMWTKTYGGWTTDVGNSIEQTTDGGFVIAGSTYSFGVGGSDVYLIKTSANGDTQWTRTYGGPNDDWGCSVQQTTDGGYIIAGWTQSFGAGDDDVYLIKTDTDGRPVWTRTLGGSESDQGYSVRQTADGGYIIVGYTESFGAGASDVYLIRTDTNGDAVWTKTYGGTDTDRGLSVQQTTDGGYIVAGWTNSFGAGGADVYLIKTDASGSMQLASSYGWTFDDEGTSVTQASDGGYVIAGYACPLSARRSNVYFVKTKTSGDIQRAWTFGGPGDGWSSCVRQTGDGGFIIVSTTVLAQDSWADICLIKTDSNGTSPGAQSAPTQGLTLTCHPNPFHGSARISLKPEASHSSLAMLNIYDASGRPVLSRPLPTSSFLLAASDLPSGVYVARVSSGSRAGTLKIVLQR